MLKKFYQLKDIFYVLFGFLVLIVKLMAMVCLELLDLMLLKSRILELLVLITPIIPSCHTLLTDSQSPQAGL